MLKHADAKKQRMHDAEVSRLYREFKAHEKALRAERTYSEVLKEPSWWEAHRAWLRKRNTCPECGSEKTEVTSYDPIWQDGHLTCQECGTFVRHYDAG